GVAVDVVAEDVRVAAGMDTVDGVGEDAVAVDGGRVLHVVGRNAVQAVVVDEVVHRLGGAADHDARAVAVGGVAANDDVARGVDADARLVAGQVAAGRAVAVQRVTSRAAVGGVVVDGHVLTVDDHAGRVVAEDVVVDLGVVPLEVNAGAAG